MLSRSLTPMAKPRYFHIHFQLLNITQTHTRTHTYSYNNHTLSLTHTQRDPDAVPHNDDEFIQSEIFSCAFDNASRKRVQRGRESEREQAGGEEGGLGVEHFECAFVVVVALAGIMSCDRHAKSQVCPDGTQKPEQRSSRSGSTVVGARQNVLNGWVGGLCAL